MAERTAWTGLRGALFACALLALTPFSPLAPQASAQTRSYDFDFATITNPGNAAYDGGQFGLTAGIGRVDYVYRIAKIEMTTDQWVEYANVFSMREGGKFFTSPTYWGAHADPNYTGPGRRWVARLGEGWRPVTGISWQEAARYANWLHNDKGTELSAIATGAYDTSTWGVDPLTGKLTHGNKLPGAKFWIPSYDEWLKAVHYDPNKNGPGEEGYWLFPHSSDDVIIPGPPGVGETSAGWEHPNVWHVPLGSYPESTSPWGLLDASGGASEMIDTWVHPNGSRKEKFQDGAYAGSLWWDFLDRADMWNGSRPLISGHSDIGFRIASSVPSPGTGILLVPVFTLFVRRRRRSALNRGPLAVSQRPTRRTPRVMNSGASLAACALSLALIPLATPHATAQTRNYDFDFATITNPGNAAYDGGQFGLTAGIGRVDYVYRIAKLEITTDQWLEYANVFSPREGGRFFTNPIFWGANVDPSYTGPGRRWAPIPGEGMTPVAGISWQEAARYANWLHNDKGTDPSAIENGAYDTSTWGVNPITGQRTDGDKLPGAKFWIPSYDEWLKAVHYDPDKNGPGQGGYWLFPHSSDDVIVSGLPGVGETSAGWRDPLAPWAEWQIPLGSYPDSTSPWGLLDASGGVTEMIDTWSRNGARQEKYFDGASAGSLSLIQDRADAWSGSRPPSAAHSGQGLRIASAVPSPGAGILLVPVFTIFVVRRRR